jgi:hypothetical protein
VGLGGEEIGWRLWRVTSDIIDNGVWHIGWHCSTFWVSKIS